MAHDKHAAEDVAPTSVLYVPKGHNVQIDASDELYEPEPQDWQED